MRYRKAYRVRIGRGGGRDELFNTNDSKKMHASKHGETPLHAINSKYSKCLLKGGAPASRSVCPVQILMLFVITAMFVSPLAILPSDSHSSLFPSSFYSASEMPTLLPQMLTVVCFLCNSRIWKLRRKEPSGVNGCINRRPAQHPFA